MLTYYSFMYQQNVIIVLQMILESKNETDKTHAAMQ